MLTLQLLPYDSCIGVTNRAGNVVVVMEMSSAGICHLLRHIVLLFFALVTGISVRMSKRTGGRGGRKEGRR